MTRPRGRLTASALPAATAGRAAPLGQSPAAVTNEWPTPAPLFRALDAEFGFTLDPCATADNAKCARYFTRDDDGLTRPWAPAVVWMNPPYGRDIAHWVRKAYQEAQRGAVVVALIPSRTDTAWWHRYVMRAAEIRFIVGRVRFGTSSINAPFPSALVVFTAAGSSQAAPRVSSYSLAAVQHALIEVAS